MIGKTESNEVREQCSRAEIAALTGFLLLLMIQESLSGIPGFRMIADTQLSHVIDKDLQENRPQVVVLLLAQLDVMGVAQGMGVKIKCCNTV